MRSVRARRLLAALGRAVNAATGALGISKRIWAKEGKTRRIATSIPPALTLRAVANSRSSFPWSSWLRTKTGIANGSLAHFSLFSIGQQTVHRTSLSRTNPSSKQIGGQISGESAGKMGAKWSIDPSSTAKSGRNPAFSADIFALYSPFGQSTSQAADSQKCRVLLHLGNFKAHFPLTSPLP